MQYNFYSDKSHHYLSVTENSDSFNYLKEFFNNLDGVKDKLKKLEDFELSQNDLLTAKEKIEGAIRDLFDRRYYEFPYKHRNLTMRKIFGLNIILDQNNSVDIIIFLYSSLLTLIVECIEKHSSLKAKFSDKPPEKILNIIKKKMDENPTPDYDFPLEDY